jgi:hypothetical protein
LFPTFISFLPDYFPVDAGADAEAVATPEMPAIVWSHVFASASVLHVHSSQYSLFPNPTTGRILPSHEIVWNVMLSFFVSAESDVSEKTVF